MEDITDKILAEAQERVQIDSFFKTRREARVATMIAEVTNMLIGFTACWLSVVITALIVS